MEAISSAGVGWVAGVPFSIGGTRGIVMYWAKEGVDMKCLRTAKNEQYLLAVAHLAGSAWALRGPRQTLVDNKQQKQKENFGKVRRKMQLVLQSSTIEELAKASVDSSGSTISESLNSSNSSSTEAKGTNGCCNFVKQKIHQEVVKFRGAGTCVPSPASTQESVFTFGGVLVILLAIGRLSEQLKEAYGKEWEIVMGPFVVLLCLQFALTPAPASQPRNTIVGQLIALTVSLCVSYLLIAVYLKEAIATSVTIGLMARFATAHPPGGAPALLFSSGTYTWNNMVTMMMANVIAIGMAIFINNINSLCQYPTYWGFGVARDILCHTKEQPT